MTDEQFKQEQTRRRQQREARRRKQRRKKIIRFIIGIIIAIAAILAGLYLLKTLTGFELGSKPDTDNPISESAEPEAVLPTGTEETDALDAEPDAEAVTADPSETFVADENTISMDTEQVLSSYAVLVNVDTGKIVAQRNADEVISPASMSKILTVLVAAEHLSEDQMSDFTSVTPDITDYVYDHECSVVGYLPEELIPVKELFYGTILPSGADAALALANFVGGDVDGFADLMNAKCEELGIADTAHFTNPVGVYDEDLHCTVKDMAIILNAAMNNPVAADALSAHTYELNEPNDTTPDGVISNWFLRRIEDKDCGGVVVGAKTGFVAQSGFCAASYFTANDGTNYICVTGNTTSTWRSIYDHVAIYNIYATGNTGWVRPEGAGTIYDDMAAEESSEEGTTEETTETAE